MIPLFRAAQTVGFLFTVITSLFAFSFILFLRLSYWQNGLWVGLISFPLIFQALWSVNPKQKVGKRLLILSLALALAIGELAAAISFWPVVSTLGALFLVSVLYALVGIGQLYLSQRLSRRRVIEYASIAVIILILMTMSTRWGWGRQRISKGGCIKVSIFNEPIYNENWKLEIENSDRLFWISDLNLGGEEGSQERMI